MTEPREVRRSRGQSAGLDLASVIAAARSLDPGAITMQAVADVLGVDRSAINNHVGGKEALLTAVALDAFAESFASIDVGQSRTWQDLCRTYAHGFADSVVAIGPLARHLVGWAPLLGQVLDADEAILSGMIDDGLDIETAVRMMALLNIACHQYAQDQVDAAEGGQGPRLAALREALAGHDPAKYPRLNHLAANPPAESTLDRLDMSIEIVIRGAEAVAARRSGRRAT